MNTCATKNFVRKGPHGLAATSLYCMLYHNNGIVLQCYFIKQITLTESLQDCKVRACLYRQTLYYPSKRQAEIPLVRLAMSSTRTNSLVFNTGLTTLVRGILSSWNTFRMSWSFREHSGGEALILTVSFVLPQWPD